MSLGAPEILRLCNLIAILRLTHYCRVLINLGHSLPDDVTGLSQHLRMIGKVSITRSNLVDGVVIIPTFSKILTNLGELRERLVVHINAPAHKVIYLPNRWSSLVLCLKQLV